MKKVRIICKDCLNKYVYKIDSKAKSVRKFCRKCINIRKHNQMEDRNLIRKFKSQEDEIHKDKTYGNADCLFTYDETLECGGLL